MGDGPPDLRDKAVSLAGMLFEMVGVENGREKAEDMIDSGKAEAKIREIIAAQGGNPRLNLTIYLLAAEMRSGSLRAGWQSYVA